MNINNPRRDITLFNPKRRYLPDYRPEVDGLRGIAVIAVILYHLNSDWIPGGYLGVDVFFALSGFLITQLLYNEFKRKSKIQLTDFYVRRIKRLFPAFAAMILFCMILAPALMLPKQMNSFYMSAISALTFTSNYYFFWFTGYFDPIALEMPLLHTWTLAVEAQFYFIFPFLLSQLFRFKNANITLVLGLLALMSFSLATLRTDQFASAGFYLITSRAWELLLGAIAFLISARLVHLVTSSLIRELIASISLVGILISFFVFDKYTPMPGKYALLPCVGTIMLLVFGQRPSFAKQVLSSRTLVSIGLVSYGLYLWHYPVLAFARIIFGSELSLSLLVLSLILILALALLSYALLEAPILSNRTATTKKVFWVWVATTLTGIILAFTLNLNANSLFTKRVGSENAKLLIPQETLSRQSQEGCFQRSRDSKAANFEEKCWKVEGKKRVLLIGDSLAASLAPELKKLLSHDGIELAQLNASYCVPLIQKFSKNRSHVGTLRCEEINRFIREKISEHRYDAVILSASYIDYFYKKNPDTSANDFLALFLNELRSLSKSQKLIVVGQFPTWTSNLPQLIHSEILLKDSSPAEVSTHGLDPLSLSYEKDFSSIVSSTGGTFISVIDHLCSDGACRRILSNKGGLISFDRSHLSSAGAEYLSQTLILKAIFLKFRD